MTTTRRRIFGGDFWYSRGTGFTLLARQSPATIAVLVGVALSVSIEGLPFTAFAAAGAGIVIGATVVALVATRDRLELGWVVALIPIADLVGLGLFRAGTGGATSLFGVYILLPIVWIASLPGFRYVVVVTLLGSFIQVLPFLTAPATNPTDLLRIVITPAIYAAMAIIINEISRNGRVRTAEAERLAAERADTLDENLRTLVQLQESQERYLELLELFRSVWNAITAQAVIGTDRSGLIVAWNPGATILLGAEDIDTEYAERVEAFFSRDVLDSLAASDGRAPIDHDPLPPGLRGLFDDADSGELVERELSMRRSDGTLVPVRLAVTQRFDGNHEPIGYLLVAADETRAIEVARMKDEFVGMISHELRTPLSSILGYLELLRDDPRHPLSDEQLQFLGIAERNAQRLLRLVGDLLFTAQAESGRFPLETKETDLGALIVASVESAKPVSENGGVRLVAVLPDEDVRIAVDQLRIGQAIDNLVSNAIKFTPRGGDVVVTLSTGFGYAMVSVRDTGVGIPDDELDRLFTRFFRATTATRNAMPGVGLGLNITKAIVTAHRGRMEVSSEEGVGTEFRMLLPRA